MRRSKGWGIPRWGGYGAGDPEPVRVRLCDRTGCDNKGDHVAPKSPHSEDKWWFCEIHAAEYNRSWNFFDGMSNEDARSYADEAAREAGFGRSRAWQWSGQWNGGAGATAEERALGVLGLEEDASPDAIKTRFRELAKANHPDLNPGDAAAEKRFKQVREAYETLKPR